MQKKTDVGMPVLAVHDKDLDGFLKEIGLLEVLLGSGMPCEICKSPVKKENLGYIFFVDREPKVCCDKIVCYCELMNKLR